jgi:uncharacterized membrane protein YfcA
MPDIAILIPAIVILLAAYFIRGITGFGSGLIAVPLLALYLPLQTIVPLVLVLDFTASVIMSGRARAHVRWNEILPLLPTSLLGILIGISLLVSLPREPLLTALALFVMFFGIRYLLNIHSEKTISRVWAIPAGFFGGFIGALFNTGGPPLVVYMAHRIREKSELRATLSGLFLIDGASRIVMFIVAGLLGEHLLLLLLVMAPFMLIGLYLGSRVHLGISQRQMMTLVGLLLVGSSISLLVKAWV